MAKKSVKLRLMDIRDAIDEVETFVHDVDFGGYEQSAIVRRAVERSIEIISEAARQIPEHMTADHPEIPWNEIRAIGNKLRHEYRRISDFVIWRTAKTAVPELKPVIAQMISKIER